MCNKSLFHRPRCAEKYMVGFRIDSRTIKMESLLLIQVVRIRMNGNGRVLIMIITQSTPIYGISMVKLEY
jgi:hypothetical protein